MSNTAGYPGGVTPPNTAPTAAQPAAVVALSPNGNQATAANQTTEISNLTQMLAALVGELSANMVDVSGSIRLLMGYIANPMRPELNASGQVQVSVQNNATVTVNNQPTIIRLVGLGVNQIDAGSLPPDISTIAFNNLRGRFL